MIVASSNIDMVVSELSRSIGAVVVGVGGWGDCCCMVMEADNIILQ